MNGCIIACDALNRPSRTVLVTGHEEPWDSVQRQFREAKSAKTHPQGLAWLLLVSFERGIVDKSHIGRIEPTDTKTQPKGKK